jgi:hypothetical protein
MKSRLKRIREVPFFPFVPFVPLLIVSSLIALEAITLSRVRRLASSVDALLESQRAQPT